MEIQTANSVYRVEDKKVLKVENGKATEVGRFVGLGQCAPGLSQTDFRERELDDVPLKLWFTRPDDVLMITSAIFSIKV